MSYSRKQYDNKKLQRISMENLNCYPGGSYYDESKGRYIRTYKSKRKTSCWAAFKKLARKKSRLYAKQNDVYTKKAFDLWWSVY